MNSTWKYLEEKGVPDMFMLTGETRFTEPVARTRFTFLVDYLSEGRLLGQYIADNYAGQEGRHPRPERRFRQAG